MNKTTLQIKYYHHIKIVLQIYQEDDEILNVCKGLIFYRID